jgi:transposase
MRGAFVDQGGLFSYIAPEARVPANHPLRKIRELVRDVLGELNRSLGRLYASEGRPSIPPEQLLSALLLQVFYGIRSERPLQRFRSSSGLIDQYVCGRAACADSGTPGKSGA